MRLRLFMLLAPVLALTACVPPEGGLTEDDVNGFWELADGTLKGEDFPFAPDARITLRLDLDGNFGGQAACNSYFGTYDVVASIWTMGAEVGMTAMGCEAEVMVAESAFIEALRLVDSVALTQEGRLHLVGEEADLVFEPIAELDAATLAGRWRITGLGRDDVVTEPTGDPFVLFAPDGTMSGSTGCRDLTGRFVIDGDTVLMPELAATGECPAAMSDQDSLVIEVLGDGFVTAPEADALDLMSANGTWLALARS